MGRGRLQSRQRKVTVMSQLDERQEKSRMFDLLYDEEDAAATKQKKKKKQEEEKSAKTTRLTQTTLTGKQNGQQKQPAKQPAKQQPTALAMSQSEQQKQPAKQPAKQQPTALAMSPWEQEQAAVEAAKDSIAGANTVTPKEPMLKNADISNEKKRSLEKDDDNDGKKPKFNQDYVTKVNQDNVTLEATKEKLKKIGNDASGKALSGLDDAQQQHVNATTVAFHKSYDERFDTEQNKTLALQQIKIDAAKDRMKFASNIEEKATLMHNYNKEIVEMKRLQTIFNDIKTTVIRSVYQEIENRVMQPKLVAKEAAKVRRAGRLEGVVIGAVASAGLAAIGFFI